MTASTDMDQMLPYSFARDTRYLWRQSQEGGELLVGEKADRALLAEVLRVMPAVDRVLMLDEKSFDQALTDHYADTDLEGQLAGDMDDDPTGDSFDDALADVQNSADLLAGDDDAPVIRLLNSLLSEAVRAEASDIHLEPYEDKLSVRLRVDGVMSELAVLKARLAPYVVSRIKVMAKLDIAEKRLPQDGRLSLTLGNKSLDVRVSSLPVRHGERIVMRLLDAEKAKIRLEDLGMRASVEGRFKTALSEPNGIVLVTGPTGSGKTTTLYAALGLLNDQSRNIMTVEDPVEYALNGISQTQVNAKVGMTFAGGLRSILRQDPDIVMVGEIRDMETAEMAVQASLTGHLVLSTVHTNNAVSAITRLADMGIERFLLASSVKAILAQRLVRTLCVHCKTPTVSGDGYQANGCDHCQHTGYRGRKGIYELVVVDDHVQKMILENASEQDLAAYAFAKAERLSDSGMALIKEGETTREEVMRVSKLGEL